VDLPLSSAPVVIAPGPGDPVPEADIPHLVLLVDHCADPLFGYERLLDHTPFKAVLAKDAQDAANILGRVSVSAIVTSSTETVRALAHGLPASRIPIPAFIVAGEPSSDAALGLVEAFIPIAPTSDQLVGCLTKLIQRPRLTALIVDDSQTARQVLRTVLEDFQLEVIEAGTTNDALALIEKRHPSLVFTDNVLSDELGIDMIERLHKAIKDGSLVIHSSEVFTDAERDSFKQYATTLIRKGPATDSVYRTALIHEIARARRRQFCA
jgi:CheY-like chemotaxis protein